MKRKTVKVSIDRDFEDILISAVRYALGRETYITMTISAYVSRLLPHLSSRAIGIITHDITDAYSLGNPTIDAPCWNLLVKDISKEMERRINETD